MQGLLQLKVPCSLSVGVWVLEQHSNNSRSIRIYQSSCVASECGFKLWCDGLQNGKLVGSCYCLGWNAQQKNRVVQVTCTSCAGIVPALGFEALEAWPRHKTHRNTSPSCLWVTYLGFGYIRTIQNHHQVYIIWTQIIQKQSTPPITWKWKSKTIPLRFVW